MSKEKAKLVDVVTLRQTYQKGEVVPIGTTITLSENDANVYIATGKGVRKTDFREEHAAAIDAANHAAEKKAERKKSGASVVAGGGGGITRDEVKSIIKEVLIELGVGKPAPAKERTVDDLTVAELKEALSANGVEFEAKATKAELVALLKEAAEDSE